MALPAEKKPAPITFDDNIFHLDLHPSNDIVATGMINGRVQCHRYGVESNEHLWTAKPFRKSCRGVGFTPDGSNLFSISRDRSIQLLDTETGKTIRLRESTHEAPLNTLCVINDRMLATGDDSGVIKIWDSRKEEAVMTYTEHEDFIADMAYSHEHKTLLAVGGDGYLSTWDIRKPDVAAMSDQMDDELLSISIVKNGKKAVVGTQDGKLTLWSWGDWGDFNDRIVGHPKSIDAICKLDEDTICTGSSDGLIRLVTILPNKFEGTLGDHGEDMPIENLRLSHDKKYIVSSGHDYQLQFFDVGHLFASNDVNEEDQEEQKDTIEPEEKVDQKGADDNDDNEEDENDDWGTDSDEDKNDKKKRKMKEKKKNKNKVVLKRQKKKTGFFSDM